MRVESRLSNFENKMNIINEMLKKNNNSLSKEMGSLENKVLENINAVIQSSIEEVSQLNKPVENLMKAYYQEMSTSDKTQIVNIWTVSSLIKINEEIQKSIATSKDDLIIVVPHIENHLAIEQFEKIPRSLKIKIIASEPHTNSIVKKFSSLTNIEYKTLENENLIAIKEDNNLITIGIIQRDIKNQLNDFIGVGVNFKPLIEVMDPLINNIWEEAYSDTFYASQKAKSSKILSKSIKEAKNEIFKKIKPITSPKDPKSTAPQKSRIVKQAEIPSSEKISQATPMRQRGKDQITEIKKKLQEKIKFASKPASKPKKTVKRGDETGKLINSAFDNLVQKLPNLKGEEFSAELQKIADLVLEKRGFSVTLHKLRSLINQYRFNDLLLEEIDSKQIIENIESWKNKFA